MSKMRVSGAALVTVLLVSTAACTGDDAPDGDDPAEAATRVAEDLAAGLGEGTIDVDVTGVEAEKAQRALEKLTDGMGDATADVSVTGVTVTGQEATADLEWTWTIPGSEPWSYTAPATLAGGGDSWALRWSPELVEPSLKRDESLDVDTVAARRGDITGADGAKLVTERPVFRFGIDKARAKPARQPAAARDLAALLDIDQGAFVKQVREAGDQAFVEAVVLRESDATPAIRSGAADIDGAGVLTDRVPLAPTKEFARAILGSVGPVTAEMVEEEDSPYVAGDEAGLSGLEARYDEQLRGTPGVVVQAVDGEGGERTLHRVKPVPGTPLRTTLDPRLQQQADDILANVGPASGLVAIRPSDGAILAAASGPGSEGYNTATYGQYAPGSTFKIVSALGLLRSGLDVSSTVPCTSTITVDGKGFKNYDDYPSGGLGDIPLRTALANSCNTAFISQAGELDDATLQDAAAALGLGVDHDLGFPAYFGSVPKSASETEHAASMIGQGKVLASPMSMAAVVASVVEGATVVPVLLPEHETDGTTPSQPLTAQEAGQLRTMMRQVVASGSGAPLGDLPGPPALAKTGTAEYGSGEPLPTHAWMVAAQGDLAVAVFVERGDSGSGTAGPLLEAFLRAAGS